ncbi:hypothetical protein Efla_000590 [Eimeria flavescens]
MRGSNDHRAHRPELSLEATAAAAAFQRAALYQPAHKHQEPVSGRLYANARQPETAVAEAASLPANAHPGVLSPLSDCQERQPLLAFAAVAQGTIHQPACVSGAASDVSSERPLPSQPFLNAACRVASAAGDARANSDFSMPAPSLSQASGDGSASFNQIADPAVVGNTMVFPSKDSLAASHPPATVKPAWQQQLGTPVPPAVHQTASGLLVSAQADATALPVQDSVEGGALVRVAFDGLGSAGRIIPPSCPQPHPKQQVLLQKLQQNEQMQRQILRNLQQQQQRWRHLLEACDHPSAGGAQQSLAHSENTAFPSPAGFTSSEAVALLQNQQGQAKQSTALTQQQQQQRQVTASEGCLRASLSGPQRHLPGELPPRSLQRGFQAAGQQVGAAVANPSALGQPFRHSLQQSCALGAGVAMTSGAQAWCGEEQQHNGGLLDDDPPRVLQPSPHEGPQTQMLNAGQLSSWLLHSAQRCEGSTEPLFSCTSEPSTGGPVTAAMADVHASASVEDGAAALRVEESDTVGLVEQPEEQQDLLSGGRRVTAAGRRKRGRRVPGKTSRTQAEWKCSSNETAVKADFKGTGSPQSCSRSPSVARAAACAVLGFGSGMPLQTKLAETPKIGLVNLGGGSCFLNVVLQCLAHLQPLRDFYLHYSKMLPPSDLLGRQYEAYTSSLEASRQHVRRLKRGPHQLIPTPTYTTSVTWELAVVINHMWRSPESVRFLKPEALYQVCCRIMPDFDPREMQDSDEFLRLLLDFLDAELRAAATGVPLDKALMMQAMPRKLEHWPSRRCVGVGRGAAQTEDTEHQADQERGVTDASAPSASQPHEAGSLPDAEAPELADLPTLFSVFFEGAEVDKVRCTRCGRCTATSVPFKSLAIAMTQEAQEESCQHASLRLKPASFFHLLTKVNLVECLNRHFADDCDSLKLSSGEGYFCEQCNSKQDAVKSCSLVKDHLPFILCLTLKRFVRGKETYKIWNPVHFDEFVDLSRYVECGSDCDAPPVDAFAEQSAPADASRPSPSQLQAANSEGVPAPTEATSATAGRPLAEEELAREASQAACGAEGSVAATAAAGADADADSLPPKLHQFTADALQSSPHSHSALKTSADSLEKFTYELVALVEHEGPATEQGHYVCYVKHMVSDAWFRADDKVVEPVDLQRVLTACPYIMFYQRSSESSGCADMLMSSRQPLPSEAPRDAPAKSSPGFAGLREQLLVAQNLSRGQWPQWRNLIAGLAKSPKIGPRRDIGKRFTRQRRRIARLRSSSWQAAVEAPPEVKAWNDFVDCPGVLAGEAMPPGSQVEASSKHAAVRQVLKGPRPQPDAGSLLAVHSTDAFEGIPLVHATVGCSAMAACRQESPTGSPAEFKCTACLVWFCTKSHFQIAWEGILHLIYKELNILQEESSVIGSERERQELGKRRKQLAKFVLETSTAAAQTWVVQGDFGLAVAGAIYAARIAEELYGADTIAVVPSQLLLAEIYLVIHTHGSLLAERTQADRGLAKYPEASLSTRCSLYRNFGRLYASQGKYDQALQACATDVYFASCEFGAMDFRTLPSFFNMVEVFRKSGREEAHFACTALCAKICEIVMAWFEQLACNCPLLECGEQLKYNIGEETLAGPHPYSELELQKVTEIMRRIVEYSAGAQYKGSRLHGERQYKSSCPAV